jgi:hypothetical protein
MGMQGASIQMQGSWMSMLDVGIDMQDVGR